MKVEGSYTFNADRETVWNALLSPDVLASCIPGSEEFVSAGPDTYEVAMRIKISAFTGSYTGKVTIRDRVDFQSYTMLVEGKGRGGTVRGEGAFTFTEANGQTQVNIVGDARVSGVIARVGQRLMGSASKLLMNQFFDCLKSKIEEAEGGG
ncbi:MAG: carbon monoxide dehydrogenase subunit G [Chloroflexi bacterium]|nr:carbon monoxide dehydrogenase subunit G [Chloroflexota bacterium]